MAVQTVAQVAAQNQQYQAQKAQYRAAEATARQNAAIQQKKAELTAENYAKKQKTLTDNMRLARGRISAAAGSAGLDSSGSILDLTSASEDAFRQDTQNLLSQQRVENWNNYINQVNYINQANAYNAAVKNARKTRNAGIFGTILGGAANIYGVTAKAGGVADTVGKASGSNYDLQAWADKEGLLNGQTLLNKKNSRLNAPISGYQAASFF